MNKLIKGIKHPEKVIVAIGKKSRLVPDSIYLKAYFRNIFGRKLNLNKPKTFNEKLQWLKLHDRKPIYTVLADKYEVKKYVAHIIGEDYIIPTLGVYSSFDEIDFNKLPNQFVLKCTHDSAGIVIVRDKAHFNKEQARKKIQTALKRNFYYGGREWPYKEIPPRIIVEKYLEDKRTSELRDYKFFCFNGAVKCFKIDLDRFSDHRANYYDTNNNLMKIGEACYPPDIERLIEIPHEIELMKRLAEKLTSGFPFLRADFYDVDSNVYFGELTFYPDSGFGLFTDEKFDFELGSWLKLPAK